MPKVNRAPSWPYASRFAWFWLGQMWVPFGIAAAVTLPSYFWLIAVGAIVLSVAGIACLGAAMCVTPLAVRLESSRMQLYCTGLAVGSVAGMLTFALVIVVMTSWLSHMDRTGALIALIFTILYTAICAPVAALVLRIAARRSRPPSALPADTPADGSAQLAPTPTGPTNAWEKTTLTIVLIVIVVASCISLPITGLLLLGPLFTPAGV
jgi:hypothetical protein